VEWAKLASAVDTIVILMGVGQLLQIAEELTKAGLEGSTPVAAIESASTRKQRTILFTLRQTQSVLPSLSSPCVIIIGEVAALARTLHWNSDALIDHISKVIPAEIRIA
jgi:uroporphyrin-III C-methyltransferase